MEGGSEEGGDMGVSVLPVVLESSMLSILLCYSCKKCGRGDSSFHQEP